MINYTLSDILEISIKDFDSQLRSHNFKYVEIFKRMYLLLNGFKDFLLCCFICVFIDTNYYYIYHRKVINRLKRLEVLHNV